MKTLTFASIVAAFTTATLTLTAIARDVEVGPIWDQSNADEICPLAAFAYDGSWNGHWWATEPGTMSVCQIVDIPLRAVEAGPIWSQADAEEKCPVIAFTVAGNWTGS